MDGPAGWGSGPAASSLALLHSMLALQGEQQAMQLRKDLADVDALLTQQSMQPMHIC